MGNTNYTTGISRPAKENQRIAVAKFIFERNGYSIVIDDADYAFGKLLERQRMRTKGPHSKVYLLNYEVVLGEKRLTSEQKKDHTVKIVSADKQLNIIKISGKFADVVGFLKVVEPEQTLSVVWYDGTTGFHGTNGGMFTSPADNIMEMFDNNMAADDFVLVTTLNNSRKNRKKGKRYVHLAQNELYVRFMRDCGIDCSARRCRIEEYRDTTQHMLFIVHRILRQYKRQRVQMFGNLYDGLDDCDADEQSFEEEQSDEQSDEQSEEQSFEQSED